MSDEPNFTMSCYATDADLYKAKAAYYEAKVEKLTRAIRMLKLEAECTSDKYLRGAILRQTVAALKQEQSEPIDDLVERIKPR